MRFLWTFFGFPWIIKYFFFFYNTYILPLSFLNVNAFVYFVKEWMIFIFIHISYLFPKNYNSLKKISICSFKTAMVTYTLLHSLVKSSYKRSFHTPHTSICLNIFISYKSTEKKWKSAKIDETIHVILYHLCNFKFLALIYLFSFLY